MAFYLAGEQPTTSREAMRAVKAAKKQKDGVKLPAGRLDSDDSGLIPVGNADEPTLIRVLGRDDGDRQSPVRKDDYVGLVEKWGARARLRCTDDEIYFRLTGTHQKASRGNLPMRRS